jgi:heme exporter protein A
MTVAAEVNAIELESLGRRYALQFVLKDLNLVVTQGKIVVLAGSNGAGKTTLLKVLATKLRPSRGNGRVFGLDLVKEAKEVRRHVAYLSVLGGHYGALSAMENLRLAATLYGHNAREVTVAELEGKLQAVGLLKVKDKAVRTYSSGMKKRLGIARLLMSDADLWLLDEPYAALDSEGQRLIDDMLISAKLQGRTVLVATHDVDHATKFADSVLQLRDGLLSKHGVLTNAEVEHG